MGICVRANPFLKHYQNHQEHHKDYFQGCDGVMFLNKPYSANHFQRVKNPRIRDDRIIVLLTRNLVEKI